MHRRDEQRAEDRDTHAAKDVSPEISLSRAVTFCRSVLPSMISWDALMSRSEFDVSAPLMQSLAPCSYWSSAAAQLACASWSGIGS